MYTHTILKTITLIGLIDIYYKFLFLCVLLMINIKKAI